ncbi:MAG: DUF58 domain-containing protein [Hydrogenobacter sp.]|uniref:DUF58 domain-containing protein n=1 Tax=Hydrogenobacter thermophilus TaxID=940 RepID=UPI0030F5C464
MKKKYRVKVNRIGIVFIGITVFFGVAAVNTSNNLLYLIVSSMLSFMLTSGLLSLYNLRGLTLKLIPPAEVYAGRYETFRLIVENGKIFPSFLISFPSKLKRETLPVIFKRAETTVDLYFESRGFYESVRLTVATTFPVGLFERYYVEDVPLNLVVFPALSPAELKVYDHRDTKRSGESLFSLTKGYDEVHSIREYKGEPVKLIHWKASAKTGSLYVKDTYSQEKSPVVLSLELVDGNTEEKISKLSYLVVKLIREGYPVGLKIGENFIKPATGEIHKRKLLTTLALFK